MKVHDTPFAGQVASTIARICNAPNALRIPRGEDLRIAPSHVRLDRLGARLRPHVRRPQMRIISVLSALLATATLLPAQGSDDGIRSGPGFQNTQPNPDGTLVGSPASLPVTSALRAMPLTDRSAALF